VKEVSEVRCVPRWRKKRFVQHDFGRCQGAYDCVKEEVHQHYLAALARLNCSNSVFPEGGGRGRKPNTMEVGYSEGGGGRRRGVDCRDSERP
jgi:hypothetical protein